jgi:hypothetical protein
MAGDTATVPAAGAERLGCRVQCKDGQNRAGGAPVRPRPGMCTPAGTPLAALHAGPAGAGPHGERFAEAWASEALTCLPRLVHQSTDLRAALAVQHARGAAPRPMVSEGGPAAAGGRSAAARLLAGGCRGLCPRRARAWGAWLPLLQHLVLAHLFATGAGLMPMNGRGRGGGGRKAARGRDARKIPSRLARQGPETWELWERPGRRGGRRDPPAAAPHGTAPKGAPAAPAACRLPPAAAGAPLARSLPRGAPAARSPGTAPRSGRAPPAAPWCRSSSC